MERPTRASEPPKICLIRVTFSSCESFTPKGEVTIDPILIATNAGISI